MLYCEFCKIFKNTFFIEHLRVTSSKEHIKNTRFKYVECVQSWYERREASSYGGD